jgi:hypothetical protein
MSVDDEWSSLAAAWQAQPVDVERLRRASLHRSRRMKLLMALDVICIVAAAAFAVHLLVTGAGFWSRAGIAIGLAALAASVLLNYRLRRGLWHAANDSVVDLLKLQRARRYNAIRMALWGPVFLPLGVLTGFLIGRDATIRAASAAGPSWVKLAVATGLVIGFCIGSVLYVRRQRRRIAAIDAHLAQLEPPA